MDRVTVEIKNVKLKVFLRLARFAGVFSEKLAYKLIDWMFINLDKFYTIKR